MTISPTSALMFLVSVLFQVAALLLMPATKGFTAPLPSIGLVVLFSTGLALLARLSNAGVQLGVLVPLASAVVPLGTMLLATVIYHEPFSFAKVGILLGACALIGLASAQ